MHSLFINKLLLSRFRFWLSLLVVEKVSDLFAQQVQEYQVCFNIALKRFVVCFKKRWLTIRLFIPIALSLKVPFMPIASWWRVA